MWGCGWPLLALSGRSLGHRRCLLLRALRTSPPRTMLDALEELGLSNNGDQTRRMLQREVGSRMNSFQRLEIERALVALHQGVHALAFPSELARTGTNPHQARLRVAHRLRVLV